MLLPNEHLDLVRKAAEIYSEDLHVELIEVHGEHATFHTYGGNFFVPVDELAAHMQFVSGTSQQ